ncbi:type III secretion system rspB [Pseudomonas aylmerensis]|uniref:Type III secretion system rspB n=1 Tax=Pseudomonas aylmerensis TaxID=1869229 RepID=A0A2T4G333_9PSED|nr:type III secretion system rspB [Pseudomonas aylmerensis]
MTKSLRALSERGRIDEARKYPGHLSDAVLLTHIAVKSIGKSAQCVDKICNLQ